MECSQVPLTSLSSKMEFWPSQFSAYPKQSNQYGAQNHDLQFTVVLASNGLPSPALSSFNYLWDWTYRVISVLEDSWALTVQPSGVCVCGVTKLPPSYSPLLSPLSFNFFSLKTEQSKHVVNMFPFSTRNADRDNFPSLLSSSPAPPTPQPTWPHPCAERTAAAGRVCLHQVGALPSLGMPRSPDGPADMCNVLQLCGLPTLNGAAVCNCKGFAFLKLMLQKNTQIFLNKSISHCLGNEKPKTLVTQPYKAYRDLISSTTKNENPWLFRRIIEGCLQEENCHGKQKWEIYILKANAFTSLLTDTHMLIL